MNADATPFLDVFERKRRLEVPLFQRQYVWNMEQQWEPLWEDISNKFTDSLTNRAGAPAHFLGAMVLDQKLTPTTHVERRQVIDGQQRLITLQIFLAAFRDFCREQKSEELADECDSFILNRGMMADPGVEKFKVWPTQLDRKQFEDVVVAGSRAELVRKYPLIYRKYARRAEPRPRMVEAYLFFHQEIRSFFLGNESELPLAGDRSLASRLEDCLKMLRGGLQVVVIDLDQDDDAQVIFETLNARGEPLLPADLLRNFVFLRAARQGEPPEELYEKYWQKFDDPFWRHEIRQGRLFRPRSDLFMQHFLASRQMTDIPIKHLYVEYKFWIQKQRPFQTVRDELVALAGQGDDFRRLMEPRKGDVLFPLAHFLDLFDVNTAYPLLLFLLDKHPLDSDWALVSNTLESYLLRRALSGLTTKSYNRTFLSLARFLRDNGPTAENIREYLSGSSGESVEWPRDEKFLASFQTRDVYSTLDNAKLVYLFGRLNDTYLSTKNELINIESPLTIEHIMPQDWLESWPLPDGSRGLTYTEVWDSKEGDPTAEATRLRNSLVHTMGNLTIVSQPLNSAVSNSSWTVKQPQLLQASLLPINQQLIAYDTWDEEAIRERGKQLFERARSIWPPPSPPKP